jgi:hypothetical protein
MHRRSTESFALKVPSEQLSNPHFLKYLLLFYQIIDKKANQDSLHLIEQEIKIMRRLGRHRHGPYPFVASLSFVLT